MNHQAQIAASLPDPDICVSIQCEGRRGYETIRAFTAEQMRAYAMKAYTLASAPPAPATDLYEAIKHGDETHRAWLRKAIDAFYAGEPIPPVAMSAAPATNAQASYVLDMFVAAGFIAPEKLEQARAIAAHFAAPAASEPVAWVPVHPKNGPLWAMTTDKPDPERLPNYPLMPVYAAPQPPAASSDEQPNRWVHVKSGGVYEVLMTAKSEADSTLVTIYRGVESLITWARPTSEFMDGRFVRAALKGEQP